MTNTFPFYVPGMVWDDIVHGVPEGYAFVFLIAFALFCVVRGLLHR